MRRVVLLGPNGQLGTDIQRVFAEFAGSVQISACGRDELDVEQLETIRPTLDQYEFDILINCTSYHKTDEVEQNAARAVTVNAHAVREMADACAARGARLIHVSTDYVFGGDQSRPYREDDCPAPVNVYGATKLLGESLVWRSGADALILRVASLFGTAGASGKGGNFVEAMLRLARERGELRVVNDVRMSPTGTLTVAETTLKLLQCGADPGVYNVVNSGDATWYEFACEIVRRANVDVPVSAVTSDEFPTVASRPSYSVLDNSRVTKAIGESIPSWPNALDRYLRYR